jgi:dTDP-4-dehydrorhamnose 3,5-epimerase
MKVTPTSFEGLVILKSAEHHDDRGYFTEAYNDQTLRKHGISAHFVQDNQSFSRKNVMRGMHFQKIPYAQTKLIRVLSGTILDVVVDLRKKQPTYGKSMSVELSAANKKQFYIPKGFAHGFLVLSDSAEVLYKTDEHYNKDAEGGLFFNDPALGIDWGISAADAIVSSKDLVLPHLKNVDANF